MTAKKAFQYAIKTSPKFAEIIKHFKETREKDGCAGCVIFSIGSEAFSYAWDAVDGYEYYKHTANRAAYLIRRGMTNVIE